VVSVHVPGVGLKDGEYVARSGQVYKIEAANTRNIFDKMPVMLKAKTKVVFKCVDCKERVFRLPQHLDLKPKPTWYHDTWTSEVIDTRTKELLVSVAVAVAPGNVHIDAQANQILSSGQGSLHLKLQKAFALLCINDREESATYFRDMYQEKGLGNDHFFICSAAIGVQVSVEITFQQDGEDRKTAGVDANVMPSVVTAGANFGSKSAGVCSNVHVERGSLLHESKMNGKTMPEVVKYIEDTIKVYVSRPHEWQVLAVEVDSGDVPRQALALPTSGLPSIAILPGTVPPF